MFAGCVIKAVRETAALMFGVSVATMIGCDLAQFLPNACPSKNATDMLIVGDATAKKGGMGSKSKKTVGKLMPLVSGFIASWQSTVLQLYPDHTHSKRGSCIVAHAASADSTVIHQVTDCWHSSA